MVSEFTAKRPTLKKEGSSGKKKMITKETWKQAVKGVKSYTCGQSQKEENMEQKSALS